MSRQFMANYAVAAVWAAHEGRLTVVEYGVIKSMHEESTHSNPQTGVNQRDMLQKYE